MSKSKSDGGRPHGPLPQEPQVAGQHLPSPQADWQAADCTGLAPVHVQPQRGSHSVCPAVLPTRSRHTSPSGSLPDWADGDAATARSRARIAPRRCRLSASDMRASRCVLKSGYNYIALFLKLITRSIADIILSQHADLEQSDKPTPRV
eukprot:scaffold19403_cov168-Isochrysis_galbana.AAC.1